MPSATSSPAPGLLRRPGARRLAFALAAAGTLAAGTLAASTLLVRARAAGRPDIVLVVWDTCRADRTGVDGYPLPTTPRLSEVAAGGVTFRQAFTPSPWTPPAHASLFTGLLPSVHGLRERAGDRVHRERELLAATLRRSGYDTVAASANPYLATVGLLEGFESVIHGPPEGTPCPGEVLAERVEELLSSRARGTGPRRPLFLFVNLMDCHLPLAPRQEDLEAIHGPGTGAALSAIPVPSVDAAARHMLGIERLGPEALRSLSLAYDAGVRAADRATGRILDALRGAGIGDGAFVAVCGDHGECLGEHGDVDHHLSVHDAVLRVPLVIRWPGRLPAGRTEDAQVRLQDLYRTILEAAGAAAPKGCGLDSDSLLGDPVEPRDAVAEHQSFSDSVPGVRARFPGATEEGLARYRRSFLVVREAARGPSPRKLVVTGSAGGPGRLDLYDLRSDPGEARSLLGPGAREEDRAAADSLRKRLDPGTR